MKDYFAYIKFPYKTEIQFFDTLSSEINSKNRLLIQPFDINKLPAVLYENPFKQINFKDLLLEKSDATGTTKDEFINKVTKAIALIKNNSFKKLVVSRMHVIPFPPLLDPFEMYDLINQNYTNTCNNMFYINHSLWMGASPELLLKVLDGHVSMYSLAGTKSNQASIEFQQKEMKEQEFVTTYIKNILDHYCKKDSVIVSSQVNLNAGPIKHLLNIIEGTLNSDTSIEELIQSVHPTPAVGGIPKEPALNYINQIEPYRNYYSGYLGVSNPQDCECYVNLRCMQLFKNKIILYAGCGITEDSDPYQEWEETEYKLKTLMNLF